MCPEEGFEQELNLFFFFLCLTRDACVLRRFQCFFGVFQCFSVFRFPMVEEGVLIPTGRYNTQYVKIKQLLGASVRKSCRIKGALQEEKLNP